KGDIIGQWRAMGREEEATTIADGIRARAGEGRTVLTAEGCLPNGPGTADMLAQALKVAEQSDVVVMVLGETDHMSGEATTRTDPELPAAQLAMLREVHERTGK